MSDLLPCPFCPDGGDVFEYAMFPGDVGCRECTASAPKSAWNRRAPPSADAEDAARFNWLIDQKRIYLGPVIDDRHGKGYRCILAGVSIGTAPKTVSTVREAIDAARREGGNG